MVSRAALRAEIGTAPRAAARWRRLIRHGESTANAGAASDDPATIPLTERGQGQARALVQSWVRPPDLIVMSPFLRTHQTAAPTIAHYPAVPVEIWPIQEFVYFSPATCVNTSAADRKPRVDAYWNRLDPGFVDGEGAESFSSMADRVRTLRNRLRHAPADGIAVFTHGMVMQCFRLLQADPEQTDQTLMQRFIDAQRREPVPNCGTIEKAM